MAGIVYVLTNEGMPGLLKIGRTDRDNLELRMRELHTTGVPFPFECVKAVEVADDQQAKQLEKALHKAFDPDRVNPKREFFRIREDQVLAILDAWPGEDVTDRIRGEVEAGTEESEREAIQRARKRRPNLDFEALGIHAGERLVFIGGDGSTDTLETIVVDNKKVRFQGEEMSLTKATLRALGKHEREPIRPAPYWSYKDRKLDELYEELHQQD